MHMKNLVTRPQMLKHYDNLPKDMVVGRGCFSDSCPITVFIITKLKNVSFVSATYDNITWMRGNRRYWWDTPRWATKLMKTLDERFDTGPVTAGDVVRILRSQTYR